MTTRQYILKEMRIMERECRRRGISPAEWISRYAKAYYQRYASKVLAPCFEGYK